MLRVGTLALAVLAACGLSLHAAQCTRGRDEAEVLTFRTKAWSSFAPPTCRMPLGPYQGIPRADPGGRVTPRFWHRLTAFDTSAAVRLRSPLSTVPAGIIVLAFPQRSPPRLLTAAACGGLRSAPDRRTRRALLHLSYSCAPPILTTALVTHDPKPPWTGCAVRRWFAVTMEPGARHCETIHATQTPSSPGKSFSSGIFASAMVLADPVVLGVRFRCRLLCLAAEVG